MTGELDPIRDAPCAVTELDTEQLQTRIGRALRGPGSAHGGCPRDFV